VGTQKCEIEHCTGTGRAYLAPSTRYSSLLSVNMISTIGIKRNLQGDRVGQRHKKEKGTILEYKNQN